MKKISFLFLIIIMMLFNTRTSIISKNVSNYNVNMNKNINLNTMSIKIKEILDKDKNKVIDIYNGFLTGYVADCPLCSGYLGCTGDYYVNKEPYYIDDDYDKVNIVASSSNLKCGSIVSFELNEENITAIVLDRGVLGSDIDLLVKEEKTAINKIGKRNIKYNLLRDGYSSE